MDTNQKIIEFNELHRMEGTGYALCHGVFDVLHAGHLAYFKSAKRYGSLVVSVTADRYVNKGPGRPYFTAQIRAQMLAALDVIDYVIISNYPTAVPIIKELRPSYYVKGPDYKDRSKDVTGEIHNEEAAVQAYGGELVFTEDETFSSSNILNRFFMGYSDDQLKVITQVKELGGEGLILEALDRLKCLNVSVIGEPIIDTYRFCTPEGISSKSPSISARYEYEESYQGGSWAIAAHLRDFVKSVDLRATEFYEDGYIEKIRYISGTQRVFEVTKIPKPRSLDIEIKDTDLLIVADFGHGLIDQIPQNDAFIALNVQTNSSNYGFNLLHKHTNFDYLSIDTREARLACHDREADPQTLAKEIAEEYPEARIALTLGSNGSCLIDGDHYCAPAFTDTVIDATGAGDAFFALSSCLVKTGCHPIVTLFLSNVFAGLKTKIIGNKHAVSRASLLKAVSSILK